MPGGWNASLRSSTGADVGILLRREHLLPDPAAKKLAEAELGGLRQRLITTLEAKVRLLEGEVRRARSRSATPPAARPIKTPGPQQAWGTTATATATTTPRKVSCSCAPLPAEGVLGVGMAQLAQRRSATPTPTTPAFSTPRSRLAKRRRANTAAGGDECGGGGGGGGGGRVGAHAAPSAGEAHHPQQHAALPPLEALLVRQHGSMRAAFVNLQALHSPRLSAAKRFYLPAPGESGAAEVTEGGGGRVAEHAHRTHPAFADPASLQDYASFRRAVEASGGPVGDGGLQHLRELQGERVRIEALVAEREARHRAQLAALMAEVAAEEGEGDALRAALAQHRGHTQLAAPGG